MSLINRIGKYAAPRCPLLEPPPLSSNIDQYAIDIAKWAGTKSTDKPNCPKVYMLWKIAQQQSHINHLEEMLEKLIGEVASMKEQMNRKEFDDIEITYEGEHYILRDGIYVLNDEGDEIGCMNDGIINFYL